MCELISAPEEETLRDRLGPDPLGDARGRSTFVTSLERRRVPIGAALLDQKLIAGIGNVYRAELLFLVGVDPARPANGVTPDEATSLWKAARSQLIAGEKSGRIVTVRPSEAGVRRRADVPTGERLYVYGRDGEPCRWCGTEIVKATMAARSIWSCPSCQPA